MSKSDELDYSRINLTDDADAIVQKIRKARTDPNPLPDSEKGFEGRPEAENLINIYAALADETREQTIARFAGQQFSGFKNELAELTVAKSRPSQLRCAGSSAIPPRSTASSSQARTARAKSRRRSSPRSSAWSAWWAE